MAQVLLIVGAVVVVWFAVAAIVALGLGRVVRLADDRQRVQMSTRRRTPPAVGAVRRPPARVPVRAS